MRAQQLQAELGLYAIYMEVIFSPSCVCLSVSLQQDNSERFGRILIIFFRVLGYLAGNKSFAFGADPDPDLGMFNGIFTSARQ